MIFARKPLYLHSQSTVFDIAIIILNNKLYWLLFSEDLSEHTSHVKMYSFSVMSDCKMQ